MGDSLVVEGQSILVAAGVCWHWMRHRSSLEEVGEEWMPYWLGENGVDVVEGRL